MVLEETRRAVTPFGGLVVLIELMRRMRLLEAVRERLPFEYRSNNSSRPENILLAYLLGVAAGARRFSHLQMLRADRALQALCGVCAFPSDDTVRNFFGRFRAGEVHAFFPPLWQWFFARLPGRECTLDLDSTVLQRYGRQEGAVHGYNPTRPKGRMHRPLLAFVSSPVFVLHAWLRSGSASDNRGAIEFLNEAFGILPASWRITAVRADGAFFDQKLLEFLEERDLPYVVVVRRKETIQEQIHRIEDWRAVDPDTAVAEFVLQMPAWSKPRRFVVTRHRLPDPKYRRLLDVPGYDFRVFVTSRTEPAEWIWHHYDKRAAIEPRFSELKEDLAADNFCLRRFFPTEAAFRSVLLLFNLLSLLQSLHPDRSAVQARPASLRSSLFTCGAIAGRSGHKFVLFLSQAWGGLASRKPLLDTILHTAFPTSPKLNSNAATAPPY